jgi:hypothetical protein
MKRSAIQENSTPDFARAPSGLQMPRKLRRNLVGSLSVIPNEVRDLGFLAALEMTSKRIDMMVKGWDFAGGVFNR